MALDCTCTDLNSKNDAHQPCSQLRRLYKPVVLDYLPLTPQMPYYGNVTGYQYDVGGRVRQICIDERDVNSFLALRENGRQIFAKPGSNVPRAVAPTRAAAAIPTVEVEDAIIEFLDGLELQEEVTPDSILRAGYTLEQIGKMLDSDDMVLSESLYVTRPTALELIRAARARYADILKMAVPTGDGKGEAVITVDPEQIGFIGEFEGVSAKSAGLLAGAGYTRESLSTLKSDTDADMVANTAGVTKGVAIKAIEGARAWAAADKSKG